MMAQKRSEYTISFARDDIVAACEKTREEDERLAEEAFNRICDKYGIEKYELFHIRTFEHMKNTKIKQTEPSVAMIYTSERAYLSALEKLLSSCADADLHEDGMHTNALIWAATGRLNKEKLLLLERCRPEWVKRHIRDVDDNGWTPLHHLAVGVGDDSDNVDLLVKWGVDINARDCALGSTALHEYAIRYSHMENCIHRLLYYQPEIFEDAEGHDPCWFEWRYGDRDMAILEYAMRRRRALTIRSRICAGATKVV
jgi:hypothetical protein